jgi:nicotinate-nucleotide adenylyltransferase
MKKIGIFGGTFNPPHAGHLIVAESVCEQLKLDKLFFVPSYISPHKKRGEDKLALHRARMVRLAIRSNPRFAFSDMEVKRKGMSFTYETVEAFYRNYPGCKLFLIIGADNFSEFYTWKDPGRILDLASLVVMNRPLHKSGNAGKNIIKGYDLPKCPTFKFRRQKLGRWFAGMHQSDTRYLKQSFSIFSGTNSTSSLRWKVYYLMLR